MKKETETSSFNEPEVFDLSRENPTDFFFLFFILCRYKFLIYKFTNSTMNIIHTLIKIDGD